MVGSIDLAPLAHSWPLFERGQRFDLGLDFDPGDSMAIGASADHREGPGLEIGQWECDLSDNRLTWSTGVYDLFGLPGEDSVERTTAVSLYGEASRAAMERLRAYAIRHRRGFTLDVEIFPANGGHRWIRLAAAPLCIGSRPVRLQGFKRDVTDEYRRASGARIRL